MNLVESHINDIKHICAKHHVRHLYAFGSVLTNEFNKDSDIDLVVDFENLELDQYADNYFNLKYSLERVFKRSVDLLEESAIRNPYFKQALELSKRLVYAA